jgi:hypothetical protein
MPIKLTYSGNMKENCSNVNGNMADILETHKIALNVLA